MTNRPLSESAAKSETGGAIRDHDLIQHGKHVDAVHKMVMQAGGSAPQRHGPAVEQAFSGLIDTPQPTAPAQKAESYRDARVAKLRLSSDAGALLDRMLSEGCGRPVDFTSSSAAEALGISRDRAVAAKSELERRNLICAETNSLGGPAGYRVVGV